MSTSLLYKHTVLFNRTSFLLTAVIKKLLKLVCNQLMQHLLAYPVPGHDKYIYND